MSLGVLFCKSRSSQLPYLPCKGVLCGNTLKDVASSSSSKEFWLYSLLLSTRFLHWPYFHQKWSCPWFPLHICWQGTFGHLSWEISFPLSLPICLLNKPHITSNVIFPDFLDISWLISPLSLWLHCFPRLFPQRSCRLCLIVSALAKGQMGIWELQFFQVSISSNWLQIFDYFQKITVSLKKKTLT